MKLKSFLYIKMGAISNAAKTGFGFALGFSALQFIGILFFILGFYLMNKDKEKEKKGAQFGIGIALMVLGVAMGFGMGFDSLLNSFNA